MKIQQINEELLKKHRNEIKIYLKEVLNKNNIIFADEEIDRIYMNMFDYLNDGTAIIIGACEEEQLLGFIWAYERKNNNENRYHINYFIVNEKNRKQGIGKALIQEIYKIAKKNKIEKIELMVTAQNEGAINFYKNQDFKTERFMLCKEI